MEKVKLYVSLIVIIILSIVVGIVIGMLYQAQKYNPQIQNTETVIQNLSSQVISAVVAYGSVTNIDSNRSITLSHKGDEMTIMVSDDAQIYEYENSVKKTTQYQNIKVGDLVNITTTVLPDGKFQGDMVIIFAHNSI
jgi:type II secretory pathway pseudopilin PulG